MFEDLFSVEVCAELMPPEKTNDFFEALFGDASEGSYDIELQYSGSSGNRVQFDFLLHERPGHCLACNLTQGLPQVFSRHPLLDIDGIVNRIGGILAERATIDKWSLGATQQRSNSLHAIPLTIELK